MSDRMQYVWDANARLRIERDGWKAEAKRSQAAEEQAHTQLESLSAQHHQLEVECGSLRDQIVCLTEHVFALLPEDLPPEGWPLDTGELPEEITSWTEAERRDEIAARLADERKERDS